MAGERHLRVRTADSADVDWHVEVGSTPVTRAMSLLGPRLPMVAWRSRPVLSAIGGVARPALGAGKLRLTGTTPNGQRFDANPLRIWSVTASHAVVDGEDLGPVGALSEQAQLTDFYIPQRGLFVVGRVFLTPTRPAATRDPSLAGS